MFFVKEYLVFLTVIFLLDDPLYNFKTFTLISPECKIFAFIKSYCPVQLKIAINFLETFLSMMTLMTHRCSALIFSHSILNKGLCLAPDYS